MSDNTRFHHSLHRELWDWLANNPATDADKSHWPGWETHEDKTGNTCFACDYTNFNCEKCPLIWPNGKRCVWGNLWDDWVDATDNAEYETSTRLAEQIRDLPVKPGVICD